MKTLYFSETSPADAAGDAILLPLSSFLSVGIISATNFTMNFKKINGTHDVSGIRFTVPSGKCVEALKIVLATIAGNNAKNIIDVVEAANTHPNGSVLSKTSSLISEITIAE